MFIFNTLVLKRLIFLYYSVVMILIIVKLLFCIKFLKIRYESSFDILNIFLNICHVSYNMAYVFVRVVVQVSHHYLEVASLGFVGNICKIQAYGANIGFLLKAPILTKTIKKVFILFLLCFHLYTSEIYFEVN